jgi:hypothetical protein
MKIILFILSLYLIIACDALTTRDPEEPNAGRSSFIPPTSPQIVIDNLTNAILEKNQENYISCFTDSVPYEQKSFVFVPTAESNSKYPNLFNGWDLNRERQYFVSLVSSIPEETIPLIYFENSTFNVLSPDSAVYITNYYINANHSATNVADIFSGRMSLSIFADNNGLWAIGAWYDFRRENDTIDVAWSNLKALFGN